MLADANAVATPEKGDVLVLLDEATYSLHVEGRCRSSRYRLVYRILNQAGIQLGHVGAGVLERLLEVATRFKGEAGSSGPRTTRAARVAQ